MIDQACGPTVDRTRTGRHLPGTPVDDEATRAGTVDGNLRRPRSVLTLIRPLTCDDVVRPQFPQALLLRRIHLKGRPVLVHPVDERNIR